MTKLTEAEAWELLDQVRAGKVLQYEYPNNSWVDELDLGDALFSIYAALKDELSVRIKPEPLGVWVNTYLDKQGVECVHAYYCHKTDAEKDAALWVGCSDTMFHRIAVYLCEPSAEVKP